MHCNTSHAKLSRAFCVALISASLTWFAHSVKADLATAGTWVPGTFNAVTFTVDSVSYTVNTSDAVWSISMPNNTSTWIFSSKGTTGTLCPVFIVEEQGQLQLYAPAHLPPKMPIWWYDLTAFAGDPLVTVTFAHLTTGTHYSSAELHAIGSGISVSHILAATNDPSSHTTFYVGTDTSVMDSGVSSSFVEKNNNGTWVSMGYGVDCGQCYSPQVTGFSISGSTVTVNGYFDRGYNADFSEVICGSYINWVNTGSATGYWSYP